MYLNTPEESSVRGVSVRNSVCVPLCGYQQKGKNRDVDSTLFSQRKNSTFLFISFIILLCMNKIKYTARSTCYISAHIFFTLSSPSKFYFIYLFIYFCT